ncbi:Glycogenin-1 [Orchesella cincta]|uniref:Glycogenin-1 n=1 Tax=Orchesella cincta TaxID=48709 RepID=A0A1D2M7Z5_ORCCI|nr:Glycogenin-1 [Orchesella cincta]
MQGICGEVWLTSALTDDEVPNALTLCCSLRRVLTSRKIAVIYSSKVSKALKEALNYGFDFLFHLEEDRNSAGLKNEDFVKLFALTLKSFDKCVFMSPNMLVVKNCDELLDQGKDNFQQFIWTEKGDTSVILLRPPPSLPYFDGGAPV